MLLFRPKLIEGESLSNYIYRLSKANGYPGVTYILELIKSPYTSFKANSYSDYSLNLLSKITLHSKESLEEMTTNDYERYFGSEISKLVIKKGSVKYCPYCLDENLKHKKIWNLTFITTCLQHRTILIDFCEACGEVVNLPSLIQGGCSKCGFNLKNSKCVVMSEDNITLLSQMFINQLIQGNKIFFLDVSLKMYLHLVIKSLYLLEGLKSFVHLKEECTINSFVANSVTVKRGNENILIALDNVFWMYEDFPRNFHLVLNAFYQKGYQKRKFQKKHFERLFENSLFLPIKSAYEEYWKSQVKAANVNHNFSKKFEMEYSLERNFTKYEIVKKFGLSRNEVNRLWEHLSLLEEVERGGKKQLVLSNSAIEIVINYIEKKPYLVSKKDVAKFLGVSLEAVALLIKFSFLKPELLYCRSNSYFDIRRIRDFLNRFTAKYKTNAKGLLFREVIKKYKVVGLSLVKVLELIEQKKLQPLTNKNSPKLSDYLFDEEEIRLCIIDIPRQNEVHNTYVTEKQEWTVPTNLA